jgi:AraC-like DNA-binding protein
MQSHTYLMDSSWRALLKDIGVEPSQVLRRAGLPADLLAHDSVRLQPEAFYRFWDCVEAAAGADLFALRLCHAVRSESSTPLLFAALCSPNLCAAVERITRYKALVAPMKATVTDHGENVVLELIWTHPEPEPPASLVLKELLMGVLLVRAGTREPICPIEVTTTRPPTPVEPYEEFLGAPLRRGPRHELTFTRADALRPFLTADEAMWTMFEPALHDRFSVLESPATTTSRVRAALLEALPGGLVTLEEIGRRLALSKRTLQRRIEDEGTSFQRILNETRESLAVYYLESTAMPASDIALLLGYDEPNSFSRAFKSWTGTTPESVRRKHQAQTSAGNGR